MSDEDERSGGWPSAIMWYTFCYVYTQVLGISHLSRDLKACDEFIACGREGQPVELQQQQQQALAATSRRRAPTPYNAPALQGMNGNNTAYNRLKKGSKQSIMMQRFVYCCN